MKCPFCQHLENQVVDSRLTSDFETIRRRRECAACKKRFTTYERVEPVVISVVKRDGRRELLSRDKILRGVLLACEKRPVKREQVEELVSGVESAIRQFGKPEIKSSLIGELVMERLKQLDEVAYVRFASVYRKFKDASQFMDAVKDVKGKARTKIKIAKRMPKVKKVEEARI